ncbi:MAG: pseudouridine synthase [Nitrosomonadales bacterium]
MLILFNKPYGVISQFSHHEKFKTLKDYINIPNVYPAGRLDADSEGLIILTDNGALQNKISSPKFKLQKKYWVQLDGDVNNDAIDLLRQGVRIKDYKTEPAEVKKIDEPNLWAREKPVRFRKEIPTSWIEIIISEGKNRQIRRMTAAVNFPTLRLIRVQIGNFSLNGLEPGNYSVIEDFKINKMI